MLDAAQLDSPVVQKGQQAFFIVVKIVFSGIMVFEVEEDLHVIGEEGDLAGFPALHAAEGVQDEIPSFDRDRARVGRDTPEEIFQHRHVLVIQPGDGHKAAESLRKTGGVDRERLSNLCKAGRGKDPQSREKDQKSKKTPQGSWLMVHAVSSTLTEHY